MIVIDEPESSRARAVINFPPGPLRDTLLVIISTSGMEVDLGAAALLVATGVDVAGLDVVGFD